MRVLNFIIFLAIALLVYSAMHGFIYFRIANGLGLPHAQRLVLKLFLLTAALTFLGGEALGRYPWGHSFLYFGSVWLGILAMTFTAFLLEWLLGAATSIDRKTATIGALLFVGVLSAFSIYQGGRRPRIREILVPMKKLPAQMSGFTIVQISDVHLGNLTSFERIRWVVDQVNALHPHLVVITGDLADREICQEGKFCLILGQLKSVFGVLAVTGNHEFYAGRSTVADIARHTGIRFLDNESLRIGDVLQIAGLRDDAARQFSLPGPDLDAALKGLDPQKPTILLYHRPALFARAARWGVDLQLSGHTHAGQLPPMDFLVWLIYKYPWGLYRRGDSYIYTTCGTGTWGPPMRLFSRSEIVKIVLKKP